LAAGTEESLAKLLQRNIASKERGNDLNCAKKMFFRIDLAKAASAASLPGFAEAQVKSSPKQKQGAGQGVQMPNLESTFKREFGKVLFELGSLRTEQNEDREQAATIRRLMFEEMGELRMKTNQLLQACIANGSKLQEESPIPKAGSERSHLLRRERERKEWSAKLNSLVEERDARSQEIKELQRRIDSLEEQLKQKKHPSQTHPLHFYVLLFIVLPCILAIWFYINQENNLC